LEPIDDQEGQWGKKLSFPVAMVVEVVQWGQKAVFAVLSSVKEGKIRSCASNLQMQRDTR
jgi:hypothetical protein